MMIKCVFIIGFDKLIKKGYVTNGKPNIHEIIDYASKIKFKFRQIVIIWKIIISAGTLWYKIWTRSIERWNKQINTINPL